MEKENQQKLNIKKVREALANNQVTAIEFYKDGSGAMFSYYDPKCNHGLPGMVNMSFNIENTLEIIQGFRFKQHKIITCG